MTSRASAPSIDEAHQKAVEQRFTAVEAEVAELKEQRRTDDEKRAADRRMVVGALIAAGLSLVVAVVAATLLLALGLKPWRRRSAWAGHHQGRAGTSSAEAASWSAVISRTA
ncbi:MAG TPA: hypothetical protein VFV66_36140 [Nonomuraea sp.]|nr:hypothetical protein [Nonomuraea sp.]